MKNASLLCDFSTDAAFLRCAEKERTRCWAVRTPSDGLQLRSALRRAVLLQFRRRRVARCAKAAETPFATWAALHSDLAHLPAQRRPSCRPVSPILKHAFGGFAPPLAALAPVRAVPTQSNRQPLSALNPSQICTRKGGANPKATRGILPHKPPIRLKKSVKQCFGAYCNPSSKYGANFRQVCFKPQANSARPSLKQKRHTHRYAA